MHDGDGEDGFCFAGKITKEKPGKKGGRDFKARFHDMHQRKRSAGYPKTMIVQPIPKIVKEKSEKEERLRDIIDTRQENVLEEKLNNGCVAKGIRVLKFRPKTKQNGERKKQEG